MFAKQGYCHERRESGTVAEPKGNREKKEEGNPWTACCVGHVLWELQLDRYLYVDSSAS